MVKVKIKKDERRISYDSEKFMWEADIDFDKFKEDIIIKGTTRELTDEERSNVIIAILNTHFFCKSSNYIPKLYLYKLKNRGLEKYEEKKQKSKSYSMLSEYIIELPKADKENVVISNLKTLYLNLRLEVKEAKEEKRTLSSVPFEIYGNLFEYHNYLRIMQNIKEEFEYALSKIYGKKLTIGFDGPRDQDGDKKRKISVILEEADKEAK